MMNPFTTLPALLTVYSVLKKYSSNKPKFDKLREAEDFVAERELMRQEVTQAVNTISDKLKISFDIEGEENIPESGPIMVYANHQSYADILALLHTFSNHFPIGFIAKDEWRKIKALANCIEYTRSVFIVRSNPREGIKSLKQATELLEKGFSLAIFPEGTRSQCHNMNEFKPGAFKFAQKGSVPILPVTLDGGYKLFEEKGTYQKCTVKIKIHPLVHFERLSKKEQHQAVLEIEKTIRDGLASST